MFVIIIVPIIVIIIVPIIVIIIVPVIIVIVPVIIVIPVIVIPVGVAAKSPKSRACPRMGTARDTNMTASKGISFSIFFM